MDPIQQFRQPMVTATGIFLGFMLEYSSGWMPNAFSTNLFKDIVVSVSITISIACLLFALFRILKMNYPADRAIAYYRKTLRLLLFGISIPFFGFLIILLVKIFTSI
ncbi:hypothetical protein GZH53_14635 [Flavihumibacter sp. R14]|nr:hypothetical protein [Flavihumibacter soli]